MAGSLSVWMRSRSRGIQGGSRLEAAIVTRITPLNPARLLWMHRFHPWKGRRHFPRLEQQRGV